MRFSPLIFIALISPAQAQTTPMTAADAFASGKSSGDQVAVQSAFGAITSAKGSEVIPDYSASAPPQSSYWSSLGAIAPIISGGLSKISECDGPASSDPKAKNHCEAVQALAKQPSLRPPNLISATDHLMVKGDAITNNPEVIAGAITGIYSACTTKTVSLGKEKQTEICEDYATTSSALCELGYEVKVDADHLFKCLDSVKVTADAACTVGRVITVDEDTNFKCVASPKKLTTSQCNNRLSVNCSASVPGCAPSGIDTAAAVSGFGGVALHPSDQGGYWFFSVGTIMADGSWVNNSHYNGSYHQIFTASYTFRITDKSLINTFFLNQILYDDNIAVWVNGQLVYHSQGGNDWVMGCSMYQSDEYGNTWCSQESPCAFSNGTGCSPAYFENNSSITGYNGGELKNFLIEGLNTIVVKAVIGKNGDAIARFKTTRMCPPNCTDSWVNQCAGYESRL